MSATGARAHGWLGLAARPLALAMLCVGAAALASNLVRPHVMDFVSYWAAGVLTLEGQPLASYDLAAHRAVELRALAMAGQMPFPYPPPYLLLVAPFGLLPYAIAAIGWVAGTFALYLAGTRRLAPAGGWIACAFPPVLANAINGQNGFLFCGILAAGLALLPRRPMLAGALLGCLALKPQLALVLPFVLLAGRAWRAIAGAAAAALGLLALGALAFGPDAYLAWLAQAPLYTEMARQGLSGWQKMASVYAALRLAGLGDGAAFVLHVGVALVALGAACLVWRRSIDIGARAASLAAATALASPYFYGYDTLVLAIAFLWLAERPRERAALATLWLLSLWAFLLNWGEGHLLNPAPLVAIGLLALVCRRALGAADQAPPREAGFSASASETLPLPRRAGRGWLGPGAQPLR